MKNIIDTDVVIIGAGSAGLYALREVRRAGRDFLMIDRGPLGTTCARVGCMPSKIALHSGAEWATRHALANIGAHGIEGLSIDRIVGKQVTAAPAARPVCRQCDRKCTDRGWR